MVYWLKVVKTLKAYTTINLELAALLGEMLEMRRDQDRACAGTLSHQFGRRFEGQKDENIIHLVLRWPPTNHFTHNKPRGASPLGQFL